MDAEIMAETTVDLLGNYFKNVEQLAQFRHNLVATFNESELRDLCFDVGVDFEELSGVNKSDKARELIAYCLRRGLLLKLLTQCAKLRPKTFSLPPPTAFTPEIKDEQMQAAEVYASIQDRFSQNSYASQTVKQLAERPTSKSRQTILKTLLAEHIEEDQAFAQELQNLLQQNDLAGDTIMQDVTVQDQAQTGDINIIGKVEGGSVEIGKSKKKKG